MYGKNKRSEKCNIHDFGIDIPYLDALYRAPIPAMVVCDNGRFLMVNLAFQTATGFSHDDIPTVEAMTRRLASASNENRKAFSRLFDPENVLSPLRFALKTTDGQRLTLSIFKTPLGITIKGQRLAMIVAWDAARTVDHERYLAAEGNRLERDLFEATPGPTTMIDALENEIAERKRVSQALMLSRERLKNISGRSLNVLEADRRMVSKALHDSIGASLAAIKFSLEDKEIKRVHNHGRLDESLNHEIASLLAAIKETKRISATLRPTMLDDLGLFATIEWFLRQFRRRYGTIHVDYRSTLAEKDIPEPLKIIIYRIVQEGLANAKKHGEAASIRLQLGFTDGNRSISLFIQDDGRGFDVEKICAHDNALSGYGLIAMRELCEIFNGSFHIESHSGRGTRINAILPV